MGLWQIFQDYQLALLDSGGIDFDDILVYSRRLLLSQSWIADIYRTMYKYVCVDEAQDLNLLQYEFLKSLCGDRIKDLMMVGDPHQMIYGFNGSSSAYLCKDFIRDFSARTYTLTKNYRSSQSIIKAANNLKKGVLDGKGSAIKGRIVIKSHQDMKDEAVWIISEIKQLITQGQHEEIDGDITLNRMVVIARNRFAFSNLQNALEENSIPHYMRKSEGGLQPISSVGKILDYGIRIKLNPKDWLHGNKLCEVIGIEPPQTWGDRDILKKIANKIDVQPCTPHNFYSELILSIHELDSSRPNMKKLKNSMHQKLVKIVESDSSSISEIERSIVELEEFHKHWIMYRQESSDTNLHSFHSALSLGHVVKQKVTNVSLMLSTVHTMKGLEKDIVFIMAMCEGIFPDYRARSADEIAEERNNAFVAVTRAKRWLYITFPEKRRMPWGDVRKMSESRFINEIRGNNVNNKETSLAPEKKLKTAY